jgi:hypothetical protein
MLKKIVLPGCALSLALAWSLLAKPLQQTWTGEISDSHCRAEHEPLAEDDPVLPSPECVKICLRSGFKYVFVVDEKVYAVANQDYADLAKFAGQSVRLTGALKADTVTVSKIEPTGH